MGHYSIQAAAQISGISDACIRAWEKRYNSITPARNESNHRLYSDEDIERLTLFNKLTSIGMRISQLSSLDTEELKKIYHSVTKEKFSETEVLAKKAAVTFYQSLYIIEESFNAKRFDVAYHELKKVIELNNPKEIALKFIPALDGICQNWKDKKTIEADQINAFERFLNNLASQRAHRERQNFRDVKCISVSLESAKNRIADSGLEMLLASHKMDHCLFSNESSTDFLLTLINVMAPKFVFLVAEHKHPEVLRVLEALGTNSTTQVIIFDQKFPLLKNKSETIENARVFNSIFEIDQFLEHSLQF
jgi:DNA-binding transcriptional MerR regulator